VRYRFRSCREKSGKIKENGTRRFRKGTVKAQCSLQLQHMLYGIQATYHDRFNAGVALRSKFDDERNTITWLLLRTLALPLSPSLSLFSDCSFTSSRRTVAISKSTQIYKSMPIPRSSGSRLMQVDANDATECGRIKTESLLSFSDQRDGSSTELPCPLPLPHGALSFPRMYTDADRRGGGREGEDGGNGSDSTAPSSRPPAGFFRNVFSD